MVFLNQYVSLNALLECVQGILQQVNSCVLHHQGSPALFLALSLNRGIRWRTEKEKRKIVKNLLDILTHMNLGIGSQHPFPV